MRTVGSLAVFVLRSLVDHGWEVRLAIRGIIGGGILTIVAVSGAGVSTQSSPPAWTGVYTAAQATAGEPLYATHCAKCHGADLAGIERATALAGTTFRQRWQQASLATLYARIEAMPPDKPKSLTPAQYTNILAFMLRAND